MTTPHTLLANTEQLLKRVLAFEHPADMLVSKYFQENRQLGARDRMVVANALYAVLRYKSLFEYFAQSGPGTVERCLAILGCQADPWVQRAFSEEEASWLTCCQRVDTSSLPAPLRHNLPEWLFLALQAQLKEHPSKSGHDEQDKQTDSTSAAGPAFGDLVKSMNLPAPLDLRVNILKAKREQVQKQLAEHAVKTAFTPYSPLGLRVHGKPVLNKHPLFLDGTIEVQDEGSQLLALLVAPKRGEVVVDFCAGAGGKTLALGAAMRNTGRLYAWDVSAHRLDALKPRLARSGLSNVHLMAVNHENDERIKRLYGKVDRVLIDAPCSGLGTLRRHPDLKWRQTPDTVKELARTQSAILESACRLLKPAGRLVYATCSILCDENEDIAGHFSQSHQDFDLLDVKNILQKQGVKEFSNLAENRYLRLWPHLHHTDGFFAAVWQKK